MGALPLLSSSMLIVLVVLGLAVALRSSSLPARVRNPRLGWVAVGGYGLAVVAALLVWGRDTDGFGIASILLGMPWSFVLMLVLNAVKMGLGLADSTGWELFLHVVLLGPVLLNAVALYHLGSRLPALWATPPRPAR
jgi:hypothetical protein